MPTNVTLLRVAGSSRLSMQIYIYIYIYIDRNESRGIGSGLYTGAGERKGAIVWKLPSRNNYRRTGNYILCLERCRPRESSLRLSMQLGRARNTLFCDVLTLITPRAGSSRGFCCDGRYQPWYHRRASFPETNIIAPPHSTGAPRLHEYLFMPLSELISMLIRHFSFFFFFFSLLSTNFVIFKILLDSEISRRVRIREIFEQVSVFLFYEILEYFEKFRDCLRDFCEIVRNS